MGTEQECITRKLQHTDSWQENIKMLQCFDREQICHDRIKMYLQEWPLRYLHILARRLGVERDDLYDDATFLLPLLLERMRNILPQECIAEELKTKGAQCINPETGRSMGVEGRRQWANKKHNLPDLTDTSDE